jgi:hypothetical protein
MKTTMLALLAGFAFAAPAMAQNLPPDLRQIEVKRITAAVEAHKDDLHAIAMILGIVDSAVICLERDTKWAEIYRPLVLHTYDQFAAEIALPKAPAYALKQDVENDAHKFALAFDCDKFKSNPAMLNELAAMLKSWR